MSTEQPAGGSNDQPGSLSEEALRLAETLQSWLSSGTAMAGVGSSSECKLCPICQLIGTLSGARPEVMAHLLEAGAALAAALRAGVEAAEHKWASGERPPVQHINVT